MPPRPSPLRGAETRERHRTRMTCSPRAQRYREQLSFVKSYPLFAMTQSAQGWRDDHGCRYVDALNRHMCPHVDVAGQLHFLMRLTSRILLASVCGTPRGQRPH
jgi:hypothetical protein